MNLKKPNDRYLNLKESNDRYKRCIESLNSQYMEVLYVLEMYLEFIIHDTDYSIDDVVVVDTDLGNHRMCKMVVCPKSCVINGFGIYEPEYFLGYEEVQDEHGSFKGWNIIDEVPDELKILYLNNK